MRRSVSDPARLELLRHLAAEPWAILPAALAGIRAAVLSGVQAAELDQERTRPTNVAGSVAVLPIVGPISKRVHPLMELFGLAGASTEGITRAFRSAVADTQIGAIVLDVDSPGGTVTGVPELADEIRAARGSKPIVAVANGMMASAAYWLGAQADEVVISPSGQAGSIGVFAMHEDISAMAEMLGVKVSLISAGKYKTEGNPFEPLSDEARAAIQADVDAFYGMFVEAVAKGRGVKAGDVRSGYGEGRVLNARAAVAAGLADRIATRDQVIAGLTRGRRVAGARADDDTPGIEATSTPPVIDLAAADLDRRKRRLRLVTNHR